jgi:hypothetical protein
MHGYEVHARTAENAMVRLSAVERSAAAEQWYQWMMLCYPAVLLVTLIVSAAAYSIYSSKSEEELVEPTATGPGGKPLPATKRRKNARNQPVYEVHVGRWPRRLFQYVTAAVVLTFVADAAAAIVHAVDDRQEAWSCGEERVVSTTAINLG